MRPRGRADIPRTAYGDAQFNTGITHRLAPSAHCRAGVPDIVSDVRRITSVSQEGFEPTTKGLRVPCSTAELLARSNGNRAAARCAHLLGVCASRTPQ